MWLAVVLGGLLAGLPGGGEYAGAASAAAPLDQVQQDQHQERPLAALPAMPGFACEAAVLSPYDPDTGTLDTSALMDETLARYAPAPRPEDCAAGRRRCNSAASPPLLQPLLYPVSSPPIPSPIF